MTYNIAMVSDFFYPQPGGVESHVYQLSTQLISRGHSVIIITHSYEDRTGIRMLTNGLKVYYVPFFVLYRESTFPTVFSFFPILRQILIREEIHIVHGHGSLSSLCHEAILHGRTMGLRTVFTDHSLFGFADAGSILSNKLLKFTLSDVGHVICVSHTCRENTVLRAALDPKSVSVIPNAVVTESFYPDPSQSSPDYITIIVISRLYPNKGADLLCAIIPQICALNLKVRFIIAGSGPREIELEQMRERYRLQERVELIGPIRHEEVRNAMVKGDIYLHPTLTEAFGTVLVEAASCGLLVVTTKVGGIPEVLPPHMTIYSAPSEESLVNATARAIKVMERYKAQKKRNLKINNNNLNTMNDEKNLSHSERSQLKKNNPIQGNNSSPSFDSNNDKKKININNMNINHIKNNDFNDDEIYRRLDPYGFHEQVAHMYHWADVAKRTERVYDLIDTSTLHEPLVYRIIRYYGCGTWAGKLFVICVLVDYLIYAFLEWWYPRDQIDRVRKWPRSPNETAIVKKNSHQKI